MSRMNRLLAMILSLLATSSLHARGYDYADGQQFTYEDFKAWYDEYKDAKPQFIDGDVITVERRELTDPFVPPGLQMADFYGEAITIKDAGDLSPPPHFLEVTRKLAGQASIDAQGAIQNFTAGTPFDRTHFSPGSREDGFRAMWNYNFRWQHYGLALEKNDWVWAQRGGNHGMHELMSDPVSKKYYGGGGDFDRVLNLRYQKVYCMNLTMLPESNYRMDDRWCDGIEWRELSDFWSPFDIAGTAFIVFRYTDPYKTDDS